MKVLPGSGSESANWKPCSNARTSAGRPNPSPSPRYETEQHSVRNKKTPQPGNSSFQKNENLSQKRNESYLLKGNAYQREAIRHFTGPCEVLAGPGSGKTFVLVERILYLIQYHRIDPSRILVLTFSKAAAMEMRLRFRRRFEERIKEYHSSCKASDNSGDIHDPSDAISSNLYPVTFGTFHSVFYQILRESCSMLSAAESNLTLITTERQRQLITSLIRRYATAPGQYTEAGCIPEPEQYAEAGCVPGWGRYAKACCIPEAEEISRMLTLIARCKMTGKFPAAETGIAAIIRPVFRDYNTYLVENHLLDFEDMIGRCEEMLRDNPEILHYWQERFQFLLVDEFQDINAGQFRVLRMLAGKRKNLFAVGDDDQSIYGFRGSDPAFMLQFADLFPGARMIPLEINYRSTQEIIDASMKVIGENRKRMQKDMRSAVKFSPEKAGNPGGAAGLFSTDRRHGNSDVEICSATSEWDEYLQIIRILSGMQPEERMHCAIIVRTHMQMTGLIKALEQNHLPWQEGGNAGKSRWAAGRKRESGEMVRTPEDITRMLTAVRSYFHLAYAISTGGTERSLRRADLLAILNIPERFLLRSDFRQESYSVQDLLRMYPKGSTQDNAMSVLCSDLRALGRLSPGMGCRYLKRILYREKNAIPAKEFDMQILFEAVSGTASAYNSFHDFSEALDRMNLKEAFAQAYKQTGLTEEANILKGTVTLLTMHASKGLEFDTVILPDLNEGILPGRRARSEDAVEEERRLFYVAMTRARRKLFLIYIRGTGENPRRPSRFLQPFGVQAWK